MATAIVAQGASLVCISTSSSPAAGKSLKRLSGAPIASVRPRRQELNSLGGPHVQLTKRAIGNRQCRLGHAFASMRDAEELVQSGVVRPIPPRDVSGLLSEEGYALLDVRPSWEREKAFVADSYHVPIFVEDMSTGVLTTLKKSIQQGQGGWWNGQKLTERNPQFVEQVQTAVPKGQKLVVACGEGLRSLLALEELNDAGFKHLVWLQGGFNAVGDTEFAEVKGTTKLRFAAVGGASEYVLKFALLISSVLKQVQGKGA